MADQDSVSVTLAERAQAPIFQNLMQLYTHDFSEFWRGTARGELNAQGLFDAYPLDEYWSRDNWAAMLLWRDRALAGFCLVNDKTHSGLAAQRNMAEFFILRKHRGQGVARIAAEVDFFALPRRMGGGGGTQQRARPRVLAQDHRAFSQSLGAPGAGPAR